MGLIFPPDTWSHVYLFVFQPLRVPDCIAYLPWVSMPSATAGSNPTATCPTSGRGSGRVSTAGWLTWRVRMGTRFASGADRRPAMTALLFSVFCMAALFAGVAIFREKVDGDGPV